MRFLSGILCFVLALTPPAIAKDAGGPELILKEAVARVTELKTSADFERFLLERSRPDDHADVREFFASLTFKTLPRLTLRGTRIAIKVGSEVENIALDDLEQGVYRLRGRPVDLHPDRRFKERLRQIYDILQMRQARRVPSILPLLFGAETSEAQVTREAGLSCGGAAAIVCGVIGLGVLAIGAATSSASPQPAPAAQAAAPDYASELNALINGLQAAERGCESRRGTPTPGRTTNNESARSGVEVSIARVESQACVALQGAAPLAPSAAQRFGESCQSVTRLRACVQTLVERRALTSEAGAAISEPLSRIAVGFYPPPAAAPVTGGPRQAPPPQGPRSLFEALGIGGGSNSQPRGTAD